MCSSLRNASRPAADAGDRIGAVAGWAALGGVAWLVVWLGARPAPAPAPGEMRIQPETVLQIALAPMPEIIAAPEPEPVPESEPVPEPEVVPEPEPAAAVLPEPDPVPEPPPPPMEEGAPTVAAQPTVDQEGEGGAEEAIRAEWLGELRRRVEDGKYYPRVARHYRETGKVLLRVTISPAAEIRAVQVLENTGSPKLAEGALGILRSAAERPLGTNALPASIEVDVPITYRLEDH